MQTAVYPERDCQKAWKLQDKLSRRVTARASSGELYILLVSTRPNSSEVALRRHCTCQDPISTTWGRSLKNALKIPVTALVHTGHWSPGSGFETGVQCTLVFFEYIYCTKQFENICMKYTVIRHLWLDSETVCYLDYDPDLACSVGLDPP